MALHLLRSDIALLAAALVLPGFSHAAVRVVANCNDSGAGSLRTAIATAASGDVIDLSRLTCTRIILTSGELVVPQGSLTMRGRHRAAMMLDGNLDGRVIRHDGQGWLRIENLTVARGYFVGASTAEGGCVLSAGSVALDCARVHGCIVEPVPDGAGVSAGGGVAAVGNITVLHSAVHDNEARNRGAGGGLRTGQGHIKLLHSEVIRNRGAQGGGLSTLTLTAVYTTFKGNVGQFGGGAFSANRAILNKTTFVGNRSVVAPGYGQQEGGAGLFVYSDAYITDSTFSGNSGTRNGALRMGYGLIRNSTIAYNVDEAVDWETGQCGGALSASALRLESSIVARNTCAVGADLDIVDGVWIEGSHNVVEHSASVLPPDTLQLDPRLSPLANNGGPTLTHLPAADSPVLDRGANPSSREYDQRGPGFPRQRGLGVDIGSVER